MHFGLFPFFGYNAATNIGAYKYLFDSLLPVLLHIYSEVKLLNQTILFDYVKNCHTLFPKTAPFNSNAQGFQFIHTQANT